KALASQSPPVMGGVVGPELALGGVVGPGLALGAVVGPELALSHSLVAWCHHTDTCPPRGCDMRGRCPRAFARKGRIPHGGTMASLSLVSGGTGTLGRRVVPRLLAADWRVRVLSRHAHDAADGVEYVTGDLLKNEGIPAAVAGAEVIVHCAGGRKDDD